MNPHPVPVADAALRGDVLIEFPAARWPELPERVLRLIAIHCGPVLPVGGVFRLRMSPAGWREIEAALRE